MRNMLCNANAMQCHATLANMLHSKRQDKPYKKLESQLAASSSQFIKQTKRPSSS
jgi:hypothetical protein